MRELFKEMEVTIEQALSDFGLSFKDASIDEPDSLVGVIIAQRQQLRKEGKYAQADEIRKTLEKKGIIIEDTKDGTIWRRKI